MVLNDGCKYIKVTFRGFIFVHFWSLFLSALVYWFTLWRQWCIMTHCTQLLYQIYWLCRPCRLLFVILAVDLLYLTPGSTVTPCHSVCGHNLCHISRITDYTPLTKSRCLCLLLCSSGDCCWTLTHLLSGWNTDKGGLEWTLTQRCLNCSSSHSNNTVITNNIIKLL